MTKKRISILGATGSIGTSALDIIRNHLDEFDIVALTADNNGDSLMALGSEFQADFIALQHGNLDNYNGKGGIGNTACLEAASMEADITIIAISGIAAMQPTMQATRSAKRLAIANKECLVSAGELVLQTAKKHNCQIIPVDSEHNALFQLLQNEGKKHLRTITLTASGGPFRDLPLSEFCNITIADALQHPNWSMGKKNTIDSATMMNKGLEVIEASHLFDISEDKIDVLIHRQSLVHALVEYHDGCLFAHMSQADMKVPIAYALYYPDRYDSVQASEWGGLNLATIGNLQFESPDDVRFPALSLARQALKAGGSAPTILNAANEAAVELFLQGKLSFCQISESVQYGLDNLASKAGSADDLDFIFETDRCARQSVIDFIGKRG